MRTILVVEDTEDDVFFLKRALKSASIPNPVQVVDDGQKALDYLSGVGIYADRDLYPIPFLVLLRPEAALRDGPRRAEMDPLAAANSTG